MPVGSGQDCGRFISDNNFISIFSLQHFNFKAEVINY